jgi:hypothetical protein
VLGDGLKDAFSILRSAPSEEKRVVDEALHELRANFRDEIDDDNIVEASMLMQTDDFARLFISWKDDLRVQRVLLRKKISFMDVTGLSTEET